MSDYLQSTEMPDLPTPNYTYVTREDHAREVLSSLANYPVLEVDTEGTGLDPYTCRTTLVQIGVPNMAYVFDVRSDLPDVNIHGSLFKDLFTSKDHLKLLQNVNYDMKVLKVQFGYYMENIYDTMLAEMLMYLGVQVSGFALDKLVAKYLRMNMDKEPRGTFENYDQEFTPTQLSYAARDVGVLDIIRNMQLPRITKYGLEAVARLEMDFTKPLAEMELNGIDLDKEKWRIMMGEFADESALLRRSIENNLERTQDQTTLFGVSSINIDSPIQLKKALNKLGLPLESTSVDALSKYQDHDTVCSLLKYRKHAKLVNTYGEALIEKMHKVTGKLHTRFKQMVSTGRMSSNNPNLQNIPGKQKFRSCFVSQPGWTLITVDQNSAELVIMGAMSGEPNFKEAYDRKLDLHTLNASRIYKVDYDKVTPLQRKASKAISFGLCVVEDTELYTFGGIKKIKNVDIGDSAAHDIGFDEIIDKKCMGSKECFEIETKYGYTISVTGDHKLKVINSEGNYVDKKCSDIDVASDYMCLKKGTNMFPTSMYMFDAFTVNKHTNYKHISIPKYLNKDIAAFLGLFISEGSIQKVKGRKGYSQFSVSLSANSGGQEFVYSTFNLLRRLFGERLTSFFTSENRTTFALSSVNFCGWVMSLFNELHIKNKDIHIPNCVKQSPKFIQAEFLRWLFEGDGTHKSIGNGCRAEYSSKSRDLVRDIQLMLLNFGIISTIRFESRKKFPGELYYTVGIVGKDSYNVFMEEISFVTTTKKTHCNYDNCVTISSYYLPNQTKLLSNVKEVYTNSTNKNYSLYDTIRNCSVNLAGKIGNLGLDRLKTYDNSGFLDFIVKNNIVTLPINSIRSVGKKKVYDISVENRELFLANGFVVHNCYGISAVGLGKRLKIPKGKAQGLIDTYFKINSVLKKWLDNASKQAVRTHYSTTVTGRKRFYNIPQMSDPDRKRVIGSVERAAKNHCVQGCIVFDSNISGLGPIGDYVGERVSLETGYDKDTATCVYSGEKDVYDLKLSNGASLGITLNHKIPIVSSGGILEDKPVEDLKLKEDFLMIPLKTIEGKVTDLSSYTYTNSKAIQYSYPDKMNNKLAFVIGALIGDDSYNYSNTINFICPYDQQELADKYRDNVLGLFNYEVKQRITHTEDSSKDDLPVYSIYSVALRDYFKYVGLKEVIHYEKSIPDYFFTETIKNKGALLNGLFSTDGGMTKGSGPSYTTVSSKLAEGIQNLLFSLGINSNLKTYNQKDTRTVYRLQVHKRFNRRFEDLVGFSVDKKAEALAVSALTNLHADGSIVPSFIPKLIEKEFRKSSTYFSEFTDNEKAHLRRFKLGSCSFTSWRKYYHRLPEGKTKEFLSGFLDFDFCWATDLSYRGVEPTYDLMCDNIHYFIANGIVVHNSDADTIKQAMIFCQDRLEKLNCGAKLLISVHDEIVVATPNEYVDVVSKIVTSSVDDGFNMYFPEMPMYTDPVIGPCWLKGECEQKPDGENECGHNIMKFVHDDHYGSKLVCEKCGLDQE